MSGAQQQFDSGGVIHRARAVLTFGTAIRADVSARLGASTKSPVSLHGVPPPRGSLRAIPRIERQTTVADPLLLRPIARGIAPPRRAGLGAMLFAALALTLLASTVGAGMCSLSAERALARPAAEALVADACATESILGGVPPSPRIESAQPISPAAMLRRHTAVAARARGSAGHRHGVDVRSHSFAAAHATRHMHATVLAGNAQGRTGTRR